MSNVGNLGVIWKIKKCLLYPDAGCNAMKFLPGRKDNALGSISNLLYVFQFCTNQPIASHIHQCTYFTDRAGFIDLITNARGGKTQN